MSAFLAFSFQIFAKVIWPAYTPHRRLSYRNRAGPGGGYCSALSWWGVFLSLNLFP